ncbi:transglutaminase-like cysteine peptidase [Bosea sp. NBC_00550]|uniref:transglutaminase-like cysteine peptidase n=1 Tax=Bosea sp. NBC_00550 TaxID=2969621 RepID=UPI00222ECD09|nr:transglutaminase-like cysteine peptidase [Bosea sp. NBC_00550]UZF95732.1 transglutaminase-like cysteine peptidase [Bosea sp. NBC_00550]
MTLPIAAALTYVPAMASIAPDQAERDLRTENAVVPFFVVASAGGVDMLGLHVRAQLSSSLAIPAGTFAAAVGYRLTVQPTALSWGSTFPWVAEYWTASDRPSNSLAGRADRAALPVRSEVLGSVALAISNAPLTQRWRAALDERADSYFGNECRAARAACTSKLRQRLVEAVSIAQRQDEQEAVRSINAAVNSWLKYRTDSDTYGVLDYWATASEILQRGTGDCKGYAILKMWMLLAAGFDRSQIRLQLVKIPATGQDHAVLVVNTMSHQLVLDNIAVGVRSDNQVKEYLPLLSFVENSTFIHGNRKKSI